MSQKFDTRQSAQRDHLTQIANESDFQTDGFNQLNNILQGVNTEITPSFRLYPDSPVSLQLNVGPNFVANSETGVRHVNQPIQKQMPVFSGGTITLPAVSGGSIVVSPTSAPAPTLTISNSSYVKALIEVDSLGDLSVSLGAEGASEALAAFPGVNQKAFQIGLLTIRTDGSGNVQNIEYSDIVQFNGGGGGGSAAEGGDRSPIVGYQWLETDNFEDSVASSASKVETTNYTNAAQDLANDLFRIECDKSKTVNTSSGTSLTINSAPSFTVQSGDIVYITSGSRADQWRRIVTVNSQTDYVLDVAFTGGDAANGDTLMVSQAVWTKDLVNFGDPAQKDRARDFFSGNIEAIAIDYFDSIAIADVIPDYVDQAAVVVSGSNEGLVSDTGIPASDTFAGIYERPQAPAEIPDYNLSANADRERLFLVFFCNPNNVSVTDAANLLGYEASFYAEAETFNSGSLNSALCFSDNSTTPINCTVATPSGQTIVTLDWSYVANVKPGEPVSQIEVYVDGKNIARYVSGSTTPAPDIYWSEDSDFSGVRNKVVFNSDLSGSPYEIKIIKRQGIYDASADNAERITVAEDKLSTTLGLIVGTTAQVTAGLADYDSLQDAINAAAAGGRITVLNGVSVTENITLNKRLTIIGVGGYDSYINGSFTLQSGSDFSMIKLIRVSQFIFNAGADGNQVTDCFWSTNPTDSGTGNLYTGVNIT